MKLTVPWILFIVFLVLKLTGFIDWSWWWISSTLWIPILIIIFSLIVVAILHACETPQQKAARLLEDLADALEKKK